MPDLPPERYESGTLPTPAIAGLLRGIQTVSRIGISEIGKHEKLLFDYAAERLASIPKISLYVPQYKGSTLLFGVDGFSSEAIAAQLGKKGICTRGGFHCAALGHATLKTPPDGAVRVSFGLFNTTADVDRLAAVLSDILS